MNSIAGRRESASIAAGKCKRKQKAGGRSGERKRSGRNGWQGKRRAQPRSVSAV